jgi:hypothetical protein
MRRYNKGWTQESERHSLARRGVKTGHAPCAGMLMAQGMGDVWKLETPNEDAYSDELNFIAERAISGDRKAQNFLSKLWGEKWSSVKEKLETEGSVWYVWYMDGVHELMNRDMKEQDEKRKFLRKALGEPIAAKGRKVMVKRIADLENRKDLDYVNVDYEVDAIKEYLGESAKDYDAFFVKVKDGDYAEVWGVEGNVPYLDNSAHRLVAKGKRKTYSVWIKGKEKRYPWKDTMVDGKMLRTVLLNGKLYKLDSNGRPTERVK